MKVNVGNSLTKGNEVKKLFHIHKINNRDISPSFFNFISNSAAKNQIFKKSFSTLTERNIRNILSIGTNNNSLFPINNNVNNNANNTPQFNVIKIYSLTRRNFFNRTNGEIKRNYNTNSQEKPNSSSEKTIYITIGLLIVVILLAANELSKPEISTEKITENSQTTKRPILLLNEPEPIMRDIISKEIKENPQNSNLLNDVAIYFVTIGKYEEALQYINQSLELNPNDSVVHYNKGNILRDLNRLEESLIEYDIAIVLSSNDDENFYQNKGTVLLMINRLEDAVKTLEKAVEINPSSYYSNLNLGISLVGLKNFEKAVEKFNKAIEIDELQEEAYTMKFQALENLNRLDEAVDVMVKYISITSDNKVKRGEYREALEAYFLLGNFLISAKRYKEAAEAFKFAVKFFHENENNFDHEYLPEAETYISQANHNLGILLRNINNDR